MTQSFQDHQIRQYLLGDLPATEEEELETAYFHDADLLARIELARDDLADDYAAARLSPADREKFERRVLAVDEGREQLAVTKALQSAAVAAPEQARKSVLGLDRRWLSIAAAIPLVIGALVAWRLIAGPAADQLGSTAPQNAQANRPAPAVPPADAPGTGQPPAADRPAVPAPAMVLATLVLTADLERSGGTPPTLVTAGGATHVDLVVPRGAVVSPAARARVESVEGKAIWSGALTGPDAQAAEPRPRARVPVASLPPGDYFFSIGSGQAADAAARYYFRVRAR